MLNMCFILTLTTQAVENEYWLISFKVKSLTTYPMDPSFEHAVPELKDREPTYRHSVGCVSS